MNEMITGNNLSEAWRECGGVEALRKKDLPVGVVVVRQLGGSEPGYAHRTRRRPGLDPRQQTCLCFGAVAYSYSIAPGDSFVGRVSKIDVVAIRVNDVCRAVQCAVIGHLDWEEDVGDTRFWRCRMAFVNRRLPGWQ